MNKLPSKLGREPLVEAIFEVRFRTTVPASSILPGALYGAIGGGAILNVERLPMSQLPEAMRKSDPQLRYSPLLAMNWQNFSILIGDEAIALACKRPYPGWLKFKPAILEVISAAVKVGVIQAIERYSLKYVDLVQVPKMEDQVRALNWKVQIGDHVLKKEIAALRLEMPRDNFLHLINVQTGAVLTPKDCPSLVGIAVDVDTICAAPTDDVGRFITELADGLEAIHASNKAVFFECLTQDTIQSLDPTYE